MKNYHDFAAENHARNALWNLILSVGPLIVGSGRKPGEGLALNSGYVFGRMQLTPEIISKMQVELKSCSLNNFIFIWPLSGKVNITIKNKTHVIDSNSMIALDCMNTFKAEAEAEIEILFFYVSEYECRSLAGRRELHGFVFDLRERCHYVERFILGELEKYLQPGSADILRQFKYALIGSMKSSVHFMSFSNKSGAQGLKEDVLQFINENALDVRLTVDVICKEFNISRSTLYRLFSEELGVRAYITQRRLDQVYTDMLNNQLGHLSIKHIAFNYGFQNAAVFKKQFMERFHFDPRLSRGNKNDPISKNEAETLDEN
ncbi:helix-turn-helix transcriptional regulator [Ochrobactrum sp. CM-21-5]|nr:helix-turn-helix transcriptional regulator [Ochrobactrum sp. CM-21-5]